MLGMFKYTLGGKIAARNSLFFIICGYADDL